MTATRRRPALFSVAGYDPSGGAGVLLDVRVFEALGFRGCGILTALTVQNASRVATVVPLAPGFVLEQFEMLRRETRPAGLKLGMAASLENLRAACRILERSRGVPRVIDPVLKSSSGAALLDRQGALRFLDEIAGRAELITPNLEEAALLAGTPVRCLDDMKEAARRIQVRTGMACLVKGGHLRRTAIDVLFDGDGFTVFEKPRLEKKVHGTGCCLSSAALAGLARGLGLRDACRLAVRFTGKAIRTAEPASGKVGVIVLERATKSRTRGT